MVSGLWIRSVRVGAAEAMLLWWQAATNVKTCCCQGKPSFKVYWCLSSSGTCLEGTFSHILTVPFCLKLFRG